MSEGIALGVPLGVLGAAGKGGEFGEVGEPAGLGEDTKAGGREAAGGGGFFGPFGPFVPDPLDGELGVGGGDGAAEGGCFRCEGEIKAAGELHGAQDTKGVFDKSRAGVAQNSGAQVGGAAVGVDQAGSNGIPSDGVEGEITSGGGLGVGKGGVGLDGEAPVAGAGLGLAAREGDIVFGAGAETEFDDSETAAHDIGGTQRGEHTVEFTEGGSADLYVEVVGF